MKESTKIVVAAVAAVLAFMAFRRSPVNIGSIRSEVSQNATPSTDQLGFLADLQRASLFWQSQYSCLKDGAAFTRLSGTEDFDIYACQLSGTTRWTVQIPIK